MYRVRGDRYPEISRDVFSSKSCRTLPTFFRAIIIAATIVTSVVGLNRPSQALPSFARQTGQPCGTCHTDYPGLTPYGRLFKLNGYTTGGGKFRTTPFPSWAKPTDALAAYAKTAKGEDGATLSGQPDTSNVWVPPLSMMAIYGYTHTQSDQAALAPYHANDNGVVSPLSFFYGGAITDNIGLFSQVTYNNAPPGHSAIDPTTGAPVTVTDPCWNCEWAWDNTDLRYANTAVLGNIDVIYGISANNNPSVQDPWNTTPAWGFPYAGSNVAPSPAASTLIDTRYAGSVAGAGGYVFIDNLVYLELTGYRTLDFKTLPKLGVDPFGVPGLFQGVAPYWRVAFEPHWGRNWFEFGMFGMSARVHPWTFADTNGDGTGFFLNQAFTQTDRYTDIAFDTQYQYQGDNFWLTLRGTYIRENQTLDASFNNELSSNPSNTLQTLRTYASLAYGNDNRIVLTGQYFNTKGSTDATWWGLTSQFDPNQIVQSTPDSNGYVFEVAYIPFISSQSPVWPWANMRVGLQYTYYNKFDGQTNFAHDNNTMFLYAWFAL